MSDLIFIVLSACFIATWVMILLMSRRLEDIATRLSNLEPPKEKERDYDNPRS